MPKARPIEELIDLCGYGFRSISHHSDGRWIVKSGANATGQKSKLFTGKTPQEALAKLVIFLQNIK